MVKPQERLLNLEDMRWQLPWAICLPDTCTPEDFHMVTFEIFQYSELFCQTKQSQTTEYSIGDYFIITLLSSVSALVIFATTHHAVFKDKYNGRLRLYNFSLIKATDLINEERTIEEEITCLYGLRSYSLFILCLLLKFLMFPLSTLTNWITMMSWILKKNYLMMMEIYVCVDTFFVMSGLLVSYNYLNRRQKGARFNIFLYYLNRIIRLTPALAVVILIYFLMRHHGTGPIWPYIRKIFILESCQKHWWSSLLYVQNYVNPGLTDVCVLQTWYLAVDMQLFILSPLLLIPLGRYPKYTVPVVSVLLLCSIISSFMSAWVYKLNAIMAYSLVPTELNKYLKHFYFPMHTRASSWIIGFLLGYILHETKKSSRKILLKKIFVPVVVTVLWIIAIGLIVLCIALSQTYMGIEYNRLHNALHIALIKPAWCLAISWIIFACVHGYSGPVNGVLSSSIARAISRISYCSFLVNFLILVVVNLQSRKGLFISEFAIGSTVWNEFIWSLILGFLLTVTFEQPFVLFFRKIYKRYCDRNSPKNGAVLIGNEKKL